MRLSCGALRGVEIFVTAAAWHVIPLLATMDHHAVNSQVISGAGSFPQSRLPLAVRRIRSESDRVAQGGSADRESVITTARRVPDLSDSVHLSGCVVGAEPLQQTVAILTRPLSHNLHSAVVEIQREAGEPPDLQSVCPGEPAEAYLLYSAAYPNDEACVFAHV